MNPTLLTALLTTALFFGMIGLLELGRQVAQRRRRDEDGSRAGLGAVEGAVFGLLGLLVAFTFSGAASRFDARRQLIIEEANGIGTAWLRIDLVPAAVQPEMRDLFRRYLDHRLAAYEKIPDLPAVQAELQKAVILQNEIWNRAVAACQAAPSPVSAQMLPALNQMFDLAATRTAATQIHPPPIIFVMLGALALMSALLAGCAMAGGRSRSWIHILGFALIMAVTVYVILDLEFPRMGLIRVDAADQILIELRESMGPTSRSAGSAP